MYLINNKTCFNLDIIKKFLPSEYDISNCLTNDYCKYINKQGKNKGIGCGRRKYKNREYCYEHNYNVYKKNKKSINQDVLIKIPNEIKNDNKKINKFINKDIKKQVYNLSIKIFNNLKVNIYNLTFLKFKNIFIFPKKTYEIIKELIFFDYNLINSSNNKIITTDIDLIQLNHKVDVLKPIKLKSDKQKKRKKELKKFNTKYKKLNEINKKCIDWAKNNLNTNFYIEKIENVINDNMNYLEFIINKKGKNMEIIIDIYKNISVKLWNCWEMMIPENDIEKQDLKLIYKQKWKEYGIYDEF